MLVGGCLLAVLATIEHSALLAATAFLAFATPATLHLLGWQRTRTLRAVVVVLLSVGIVAVVGGVAGARLHDHYFGPTHPASSEPDRPVDLVEWLWFGGTTTTTSTVKAKLRDVLADVTLAVATDPAFLDTRRVAPVAIDARGIATFELDRLSPDTTYHLAVASGDRLEQHRLGRLRTFPSGAASFRMALASCARAGSNGAVFDAIRADDPLLFIATGDLFYGNVSSDDPDRFAELYDQMLGEPGPSALYRSTNFAYTWDDHDFGANDADASSASRQAALSSYDAFVPHYPYARPELGVIAQAFTVGRVRVVITDERAARVPSEGGDDAGTMLGPEQRAWLLAELVAASRSNALVIWVSASPWITRPTTGDDSWEGFAPERRLIADELEAAEVDNLLMVSGDAHMLAIDDGSNNRFSTSGVKGFPVFHAAPLDRPASVKGGPYGGGVSARPGQYGLIDIADNGRTIDVTLTGRTWDGRQPLAATFEVP
jgi:hypothetical protein